MITLVSGRASRMVRHASTPLPSGNRMSMTMTSGLVLAAVSIASAVVAASPTTSISLWRPISVRRPSRTTSWSSTSITRVCVSAIPLHYRRRQLEAYSRAAAGLALNAKRAADGERALAHVVQPVAGRTLLEVKADAVVRDQQDDAAVLVEETHRRVARASVARDVPQRVGRDVVGGLAPGSIEAARSVRRDLDVDVDESVRMRLLREQRQRFRQWLIARLHLPQPEHVPAKIRDRGIETVDRAPELIFRVRRLGVDALGDVLEQQAYAIQRLHDAVVKVHADALALLLQVTEQTEAARQRSDECAVFIADTRRRERLDHALLVEHAKGRVLRVRHRARLIRDALQHLVAVELRGEREPRGIDRLQLLALLLERVGELPQPLGVGAIADL